MKKLFATFFLLGLFSTSAFAQTGIDVGIRLSPIISFANSFDSTGTKLDGFKGRIGFAPGLMLNYNFTKNFGIHTGISAKMHGYGYKSPIIDYKYTVGITSIEIPIGLRLLTPEIGGSTGIRVRAIIGAAADVNVSGKFKSGSTTAKFTYGAPIAANAFGSLGIDWTLEKIGRFDLGVRYNQGLTDAIRKNGDAKLNLHYIGLDLGYYFNWGE